MMLYKSCRNSLGDMVRVGPVHYNTVEEIERFGEVLGEIATA